MIQNTDVCVCTCVTVDMLASKGSSLSPSPANGHFCGDKKRAVEGGGMKASMSREISQTGSWLCHLCYNKYFIRGLQTVLTIQRLGPSK